LTPSSAHKFVLALWLTFSPKSNHHPIGTQSVITSTKSCGLLATTAEHKLRCENEPGLMVVVIAAGRSLSITICPRRVVEAFESWGEWAGGEERS
jgi:hypothetical protein